MVPSIRFTNPLGGIALPHGVTYSPAAHLRQMGVRVEYIEGLTVAGQYIHDERLVEIKAGLAPLIERSVMAHEAAHAELRHQPEERWCHALQNERMASAMAGRRLINFRHFMELKELGVGEREMAQELGVARGIVRAYLWITAPAWQLAACISPFAAAACGFAMDALDGAGDMVLAMA